MRTRLRQIVMVARDIGAIEPLIEDSLGVELCFRDPGVGVFGLRNVLFPIGDQFLEVVSPAEPGTTAGRLLDKRGGDGGYMVIVEVDDLERARELVAAAGARIVFEANGDSIVGLHLHPKDVGGAILSIDSAATWGEWPWAGPEWRDHVRDRTVDAVLAVEVEADDPVGMAVRWAAVLDGRLVGEGEPTVVLDDGEIRFVPAGERGEGVSGFVLRAAPGADPVDVTIGGCRLVSVRP